MPGTPISNKYQNLAVGAGVVTLTVPGNADYAVARAETNPIRWTDDGTAPTAANGIPMLVADLPLRIENPQTFKCFAVAAAGVLHVTYYTS